MALVIETHDLTKRFGTTVAVDHLSLEVPRGGVFGLLGPNGSGKTTTIGMLLGLVVPTAGTIRLFDNTTPGVNQADLRRVGAIVESPAFYPYLSGHANLRYFAGIGRNGGQDEIGRLIDLVGLTEAADRRFQTYSLGMKQRLGIAYALLGDPELVYLDEPTNGLDPAGVAEVRELIRRLGSAGRTVILSSHLLNEVQQVADRVAILSKGHLIAQGTVAELLRSRESLRLHTTDDAHAATVTAALPFVMDVSRQEDGLLVTMPLEHAWEVSRALAAEQVYVAEMAPLQTSLERYFLEVTGERVTPDNAVEPAEVGK
ncbi:MAG TPA: ABC transporter ATP-binding protein [Thermomicrobiaceae bacterium]|nr:ABC transporter ATP-binding protein [Thermomicrobiaceae bacterium]